MRRRLHRLALAAWFALAAVVGSQSGAGELVQMALVECGSCAHAEPEARCETAGDAADRHSGCDDSCPDGDCAPGCELCACCPASFTVLPEAVMPTEPTAVTVDVPRLSVDAAPVRAPAGVFRPPRHRA